MKTTFDNVSGVTMLTSFEQQKISGGLTSKPSITSSFWYDTAYLLGTVVKGFVVFGTEGGRNAGLTVR